MKIIILVGSARKGHTYRYSHQFAEELSKLDGELSCEVIRLSEYHLHNCIGCITCFDTGEENCPYSDDIAELLKKVEEADGVVFATPNYGFHMSGLMKTFIDRISFNFHRPRYFGKTATSIVTQGFYKGQDIIKYFQFISKALGFASVKGIVVTTVEPMSQKQGEKNSNRIIKLASQFSKELGRNHLKPPTIFELMIFRMGRIRVRKMLNENFRDYTYYEEKGWFDTDFYYPVKLNPVMKVIGKLFDWITDKTVKENKGE